MPLSIRTRKTMPKFDNGHGNASKLKDLLYDWVPISTEYREELVY
jgi:hypothetical protein